MRYLCSPEGRDTIKDQVLSLKVNGFESNSTANIGFPSPVCVNGTRLADVKTDHLGWNLSCPSAGNGASHSVCSDLFACVFFQGWYFVYTGVVTLVTLLQDILVCRLLYPFIKEHLEGRGVLTSLTYSINIY